MVNKDVKREMFEAEVKQYHVATRLGIKESSLSRMLRTPLSELNKLAILKAIEELKAG